MDEGVKRHHSVQAGRPQVQRRHVSLYQAGRRDQVPGAGELDGGEINADDPQPVVGQCAGRWQADAAAQIGDRGAGGQQVS